MESQLQRPSHEHLHYEQDPHNVGLHSGIVGEGEAEHHHGEKKSVLKKVKDKAKKIKDTIKKHGHGHGPDHDHEHRREDNYNQEGYEEESEDEEIANDPEVHGAPLCESSVIRSINLPHTNLEKPTDSRDYRYDHDVKDQGIARPLAPRPATEAHAPENKSTLPTGPAQIDRKKPNVEESRPYAARPAMEAHAPENKSTLPTGPAQIDRNKPNVEESNTKIGLPVGLEKDPHSPYNSPADIPPSNYQSKVADPTGAGGKEAYVAPLVREFGNLNVHEAPVSKPELEQRPVTGFNPESKLGNPELNPKDQDSATTENTSIAGKISSDTYSVANKAASAKDMVASKLGYGGGNQEGQDSSLKKPVSESASEYAHKVADTLAPVYGKVAGAGTAVMSKVHGSSAQGHNDSVSMKEYLSEKFRPGDEDKALSEAITNALHKKKEVVGPKVEEKPVGKVTVSEEVAARLGSEAENKREGEDAVAAGQESSGQGVVDRLRDAVGSWLGKSNGVKTAQESVGRSYVSNAGSGSSGVGTR